MKKMNGDDKIIILVCACLALYFFYLFFQEVTR